MSEVDDRPSYEAEWVNAVAYGVKLKAERDVLAARVEQLEAATHIAQQTMWADFQHHYRQSKAEPPERSSGCEHAIERLRELAALAGRPDQREVVEIGMEHLWEIVYGAAREADPVPEVVLPPEVEATIAAELAADPDVVRRRREAVEADPVPEPRPDRTFPAVHPRLPNDTPVCIGDRLLFPHPDRSDENVEVTVASLHFDQTDYGDGEGPLGWIVTDRTDPTYEFPLDEVVRVIELGSVELPAPEPPAEQPKVCPKCLGTGWVANVPVAIWCDHRSPEEPTP